MAAFWWRCSFATAFHLMDAEPPNWPYGVDRTNENNLYMIKPDEKLNTAINNEFVHMHQQADYGTSITDLLTTLFVQIVALNYSVEFGRGHIYFKKDLFRSNVVSTLREIELFKANLRFIKSSWQNIEYGFTMNYFLVVRRWRIDGQLKFFERLYPLILQPNFSMKSASFSDESSSEPQFVSILGTTEFEADDIRAEMEILKRYFIGYDYAIKRQVWSHFKNKDSWFSFSSDTLLKQKMENELKYIHWQSDEATNLTELLSILFVQYQAAVYAIRYAHGSVYYENRSDGSKSILCSSVAAYLGWYATESTSVIKAIKRILRVKFPDNSFDFDSFAQSMNRISLVVDEAINDEYSSAEDDISFDLSKFEDDEFKIDVQVANSFFRNLILWEKNHSEQNVVDVKGCKILWDEVNTIYKMLTTSPMDKFKNVYTDVKDMYISTAAAIIQIAELSLVEDMIFNKEKDFKNGFEDETFQVDSVNYDSVEELLRFKKILIGI